MNWTPDRPTKPGKYWLSIGIDHREKFASDVCREPHHVYLLDIFEEGGGLWLDGVVEVGHCLPASALFNRYVEPADPHAQPVAISSARQFLSITTEERQTLSGALHTMAESLRRFVETNPNEAGRALPEAAKMDELNARICASPQPTLRSRIEALPWHACPSGGGPHIERSAVLALLDEVTG